LVPPAPNPTTEQNNHFLVAISPAAVFFGADTSIGKGPNFMVKNITQQVAVHTPSFFGYPTRYALPIFIPISVIASLPFFSKWRIL
jgi:Na+/H+ antiporter NhaD/arsenite permease-like protein